MAAATLTLSSKNYSSWSMRGWLMCKLAGIDFEEVIVEPADADARAEILLLSPSILVPCLVLRGRAGLGHARHRRISARNRAGEEPSAQGSGGARPCPGDLRRDALGLRLAAAGAADEHQGAFPGLQDLVEGAGRHRAHQVDLERMPHAATAGRSCSATPTLADAMYAPVVSRFRTYDVKLDGALRDYAERIWDMAAGRRMARSGARRKRGNRRARGRILTSAASSVRDSSAPLFACSVERMNVDDGGRLRTRRPCADRSSTRARRPAPTSPD